MKLKMVLLFLVSGLVFAESIQSSKDKVLNSLEHPIILTNSNNEKMKLSERMQRYNIPSVSIAFVNNNKIEWTHSEGFIDSNNTITVSDSTIYQAASISKFISSIAALKLVENKQIDLDRSVNDYLTSWKVKDNEFTIREKVTLRRLLSHTAGFTIDGFKGYNQNENLPTLSQILNGEPPANSIPVVVDFVPGSNWRYSGGGFAVLQQLVEDVSHMKFSEYMNINLFSKLKMKSSEFKLLLGEEVKNNVARGHTSSGEILQGKWFNYPEFAAAGLWSNASDLAKIIIYLNTLNLQKKNFSKIISKKTLNEMFTPKLNNFGLGVFLKGQSKDLMYYHGGSNSGFKANITGFLHRGQGIVILTNGDSGSSLIQEILFSVAKTYNWPHFDQRKKESVSIDLEKIKNILGEYEIKIANDTFSAKLEIMNNKLSLSLAMLGNFELLKENENSFFSLESGAEFSFLDNEQGRKILRANLNGNKFDFIKK